jgi:hypothetical protein
MYATTRVRRRLAAVGRAASREQREREGGATMWATATVQGGAAWLTGGQPKFKLIQNLIQTNLNSFKLILIQT